MRRITTDRIDTYYARLAHERGLSPASIRHVHAVVRGALGQAVRWAWIPSNPASTASPPKLRRREIQPPAIASTRALLLVAESQDPDFGALLRVLVTTERAEGRSAAFSGRISTWTSEPRSSVARWPPSLVERS